MGLDPPGEAGQGCKGGGNGGDRYAVELLRPMRGWHIGYPHLEAVRG